MSQDSPSEEPQHDSWWLVGLGNPGEKYLHTRHNIGFQVLDRLALRFGLEWVQHDRRSLRCEFTLEGRKHLLVKPQTFMNRSGEALWDRGVEENAGASKVAVLYDDADLELGRVRLRTRGGAGGHNGIRSLLAELGDEEFLRLKVGVRGGEREFGALADYVLAEFEPEEMATVNSLVDLAADATQCLLKEGLSAALNQFSGKSVDDSERERSG